MKGEEYLQEIWDIMVPMSKERSILEMDTACRNAANRIHLKAQRILHSVLVMVSVIVFHTKYTRTMGGTVNSLILLNLYLPEGLEE